MYIKELKIHNFRAFQKPFDIKLNKHITAIAGMNGIGKSTILAILTNSSELKVSEGRLLDKAPFRGEFANIIHYDSLHDTSGNKATVIFNENVNKNTNKVDFRATIQNPKYKHKCYKKIGKNRYKTVYKYFRKPRYRLIPKIEKNGWKSTAKVSWPVVYLGLSRVYPVGEGTVTNISSIPTKISQEIVTAHANIMDENIDPRKSSFENIKLGDLSKKKAGISTGEYSAISNSNGQDDLGKIILAVLSFKNIKKRLGSKYNGGLIAIDELDATLHPAAQYNLLDWLYKESEALNLQIVYYA